MSDFSAFISITPTPSGHWQLMAPMPFDLMYGQESTRVTVPAGFISDGPTIPWFARFMFNPANSRFMKAAILHDWMVKQKDEDGFPVFRATTSARAFRDALNAADVNGFQANIMHVAVLLWTGLIVPMRDAITGR